jgi:hypothetical protein
MLNTKIFIIFLVGLITGVLLSSVFIDRKVKSSIDLQQTQESLNACEEQFSQIKEKLKTLENIDGAQTSDEILAQMMKIFMADWGLKLEFSKLKKNQAELQLAKCEVVAPSAATLQPVKLTENNSESKSQAPIHNQPTTVRLKSIPKGLEVNIISASNEDEAFQLVEKLKSENLFDAFAATKEIGIKEVQFIEGKFIGEVKPQNTKQKTVDIELELEIKKRKNPPEGNFNLSEYVEGKRNSRTSGRGQFKNLSKLQDSNAIYIERNGGDNVMHLYYVHALDALVGNDYAKSGKNKLEYNGRVYLKRFN